VADPRTISGRCECGAVEYEVEDTFSYAMNCHCSNCRASTGSAFKPFAGIERDKLRVTKGADTLLVWGDGDGNHTRCAVCGSLLYSVVDAERVHVALGSLRDEPSLRPARHIRGAGRSSRFEFRRRASGARDIRRRRIRGG